MVLLLGKVQQNSKQNTNACRHTMTKPAGNACKALLTPLL
jgi:hypothetical protein